MNLFLKKHKIYLESPAISSTYPFHSTDTSGLPPTMQRLGCRKVQHKMAAIFITSPENARIFRIIWILRTPLTSLKMSQLTVVFSYVLSALPRFCWWNCIQQITIIKMLWYEEKMLWHSPEWVILLMPCVLYHIKWVPLLLLCPLILWHCLRRRMLSPCINWICRCLRAKPFRSKWVEWWSTNISKWRRWRWPRCWRTEWFDVSLAGFITRDLLIFAAPSCILWVSARILYLSKL
jgi:hypothetical protein